MLWDKFSLISLYSSLFFLPKQIGGHVFVLSYSSSAIRMQHIQFHTTGTKIVLETLFLELMASEDLRYPPLLPAPHPIYALDKERFLRFAFSSKHGKGDIVFLFLIV